MSCYIFATPQQKQACLTTGLAETMLLDSKAGEPVTGFSGVRMLAAGSGGGLFATDLHGRLSAESGGGPTVENARRIVIGRSRIFVLAADGLHLFDRRTLQHLQTLDAEDTIDIAAAADDGLWRLGRERVERLRADGRSAGEDFETGPAERIASAGSTLFLLYPGPERLELLAEGNRHRPVAIDLARLLASAGGGVGPSPVRFGGSDLVHGKDQVLLWRKERDSWPDYVVLDPAGSVVARGRHDHPAKVAAIALADGDLVTAFEDGAVRRFAGAGAGGGTRWLTPALDTGSHGETWLRAEANVVLPEGATLSLRWAALPDEPLRQSIEKVQADRSRSAGDRLATAAELLRDHFSPEFTYQGQLGDGGIAQRLDFPLGPAAGPFLWLYLKLRRNDAARAPAIVSLIVHHGPDTLIDRLPAIYRGSGDADGTMQRMVGVLEATTHGIDGQIAALASRLDPERTEGRWLPELAATLGLPFDEALPTAMQRRLVGAAGALLAGRGTRAGLAAMFEALFPGRRVAIRDRAALTIPVAPGGGGFAGSRLPALLTGPSIRSPRLSRRLVLGRTGLSPVDGDGRVLPAAEVVVRVPATGGERRRLGHAIRQMAEAMVPAGVRLTLRWAPWRTGRPGMGPDGLTLIEDPQPLELGDGRLGKAVLGGRRGRVGSTSLGPGGHRLH